MKALGIIGVLFSVISISIGMHLHFIYAKAVVLVNKQIDASVAERGVDFLQSPEYKGYYELVDFQTTYGMLVLLLGTVSILLSLFPALKKFKIAWIGVLFGFLSFAIGAVYATHMFD